MAAMQSGARLAGRYLLDTHIGRGGMAAVWRATDELLHRPVAVKLLEITSEDVDRSAERFVREARATAALSHPNIVTIFDTGVDGTTAFLVMELLAGPNLRDRLAANGPLPVDDVLRIGGQVAGALAAAHATGMVHRDVKPANIVHSDPTTVKVVDFGVVRMLEETTDSFSLTATHAVIGTAAYLSPEQAAGGPVDARSDLYGLGCVLFTLLTDRAPFGGDSAVAVLGQHLHSTPPPLASLRPDTPPALAQLVDQLLAKDPNARPQTALDVERRLAQITAGDTTATTVLPPAVASPDTAVLPILPVRRRRTGLFLVAAAIVVALTALAVVLALTQFGGDDRPVAKPSHSPSPAPSTTPSHRPTHSPSPKPSKTAPAITTPADAVSALQAALAQAASAGDIDEGGAKDLAHRLDDIAKTIADPKKSADAGHKVGDLVQKIDDLAAKDQLSPAGRSLLEDPLAALVRLVPPEQ
jgi:serine/threonine-protein kinase